jgi:hypothetical protein
MTSIYTPANPWKLRKKPFDKRKLLPKTPIQKLRADENKRLRELSYFLPGREPRY